MHIVRCETSTYLQTNYMERGPLKAENFTTSQFTGIARNWHCFGLLTGYLHEYRSQRFDNRAYFLYEVMGVVNTTCAAFAQLSSFPHSKSQFLL